MSHGAWLRRCATIHGFLWPAGLPPGGIAFGLDTSIGEIQILNALDLDMQPRQRFADHVGTVRAAGKLLPTPGIKSMFAEQRRKFALTHLALLPAVHGRPPLVAVCTGGLMAGGVVALRKERQTVKFAFR